LQYSYAHDVAIQDAEWHGYFSATQCVAVTVAVTMALTVAVIVAAIVAVTVAVCVVTQEHAA